MKFYALLALFIVSAAFSQKVIQPESPDSATSDTADSFAASLAPLEIDYIEERERRDCEAVDLRDEFEARGLPDRRHQDSTGWCYAFVGADLVSYELGKNISPADIARQYLNHGNPEHLMGEEMDALAQTHPLGGGFTYEALIETQEHGGFCQEEEFPSEDYSRSVAAAARIQLDEYGNRVKVAVAPICLNADSIAPLYEQIPIRSLLELVNSNEMRAILNTLSRSTCSERFSLPDELELKHVARRIRHPYDSPKNLPFQEAMDEGLGQGRPVALGVDSSAFGPNPLNRVRLAPSPRHQVLLAGRRFNEERGRCEYLIRNTESGCQNYNQEFECENNHFWMPRELVRMAGASVDYYSSGGAGSR